MSAGDDIAIRATGLSKVHRSGGSEVVVFADLNIEIRRGERVAITGESGAGKSTLLHLLGGLDVPTQGAVFFGKTNLSTLPPAGLAEFRNRHVGFVWQIHYLLPEFTALENVMMPLLIRGERRHRAIAAALALLAETGLEARASHRAGELSGGEQQRVALARALAGRPSVLLADEPTGNLDYHTGERIISLLTDLHHQHRLTSVYVTHNLSFARRCDRVLLLEGGRLTPATDALLPGALAAAGTTRPVAVDAATSPSGQTYV